MGLFERLGKLLEVPNTITNTINIDKEIHDAVFSAQDELIKEAESILNNIKTDIELGKPDYPQEEYDLLCRLKALGFNNQPQIVELQQKLDIYKEKEKKYLDERRKAREVEGLINYYKEKYPRNRFITKESIKSICNRFGLLFAPISLYSAEIPLKNMREIAEFKCEVEDKMYSTRVVIDNTKLATKLQKDSDRGWRSYKVHVDIMLPKLNGSRISDSTIVKAIKEKYDVDIYSWDIDNDTEKIQKVTDSLSDAMMIAPKNKFKIPEDYAVENGFEAGYRKIVEVKDPVVLQPVKGGYLIVSAWGFEETLPEISGNDNVNILGNSN